MALKIKNNNKFVNNAFHNWYNTVLGFSDQLVDYLINKFQLKKGMQVLDPFCGSGTTLIECAKKGIKCFGIDANPASVFATKVKTNWNINCDIVIGLLKELEKKYITNLLSEGELFKDRSYHYIKSSGMLERGWISILPLKKAIALKIAIKQLDVTEEYKNLFLLSLISEVIFSSNIKFGPELYCSTKKEDSNVFLGFETRIRRMVDDLKLVTSETRYLSHVVQGDSRFCDKILYNLNSEISSVICSPPYPTEHDYTRNSRLELAILEDVIDLKSLQTIKKEMIRSHTKGIYKSDNDSNCLKSNKQLTQIIEEITRRIKDKTHGFAQLYPKVVKEYFGGMKKHFTSLSKVIKKGTLCAYVVGDQSSYLRVHIPTAEILASIANTEGYEVINIEHWRNRWSTTTSKNIKENILLIKKR